ncbi:ras-related protein Rap-2c-like [Haliotis rufescens]|uniref:ras-related protein Rap-2c-like n=1 Tax=Haliotis rufescens TaxID=6454 RepID=UPI00201F89B7|nr:ras-related protein Rap-2c-like [Haliotis rufescens]
MAYSYLTSGTASTTFTSSTFRGDTFRIAVMGAAAVGKTTIISQFVHGTFPRLYWPTVQERYTEDIDVNGKSVVLDIFDTPGGYCFSYLRELAIANADAFVLVYSVGAEASLETVANLRDMIVRQKPAGVPIVVVGNKTDLIPATPRFMSSEKTECMVNVGWQHTYMEVSVKDSSKVSDIFREIAIQTQSFLFPKRNRINIFQRIKRRLKRSESGKK